MTSVAGSRKTVAQSFQTDGPCSLALSRWSALSAAQTLTQHELVATLVFGVWGWFVYVVK